MKRPLSTSHADFLLQQMESTDDGRVKRALQDLCKQYRSGFVVQRPERASALRGKLNSLVFRKDQKVRRWALNAIALAGKRDDNEEAVSYVLGKASSDPELFAAAVAALSSLNPGSILRLSKDQDIDRDILVLAALQHGQVDPALLAGTRIDIERAASEVLRARPQSS